MNERTNFRILLVTVLFYYWSGYGHPQLENQFKVRAGCVTTELGVWTPPAASMAARLRATRPAPSAGNWLGLGVG